MSAVLLFFFFLNFLEDTDFISGPALLAITYYVLEFLTEHSLYQWYRYGAQIGYFYNWNSKGGGERMMNG